MLGKLVAPEARVILILRDPVVVHVLQQVVFSEGFEECADVGTGISGYWDAVRLSCGGVRRRDRVVLAS